MLTYPILGANEKIELGIVPLKIITMLSIAIRHQYLLTIVCGSRAEWCSMAHDVSIQGRIPTWCHFFFELRTARSNIAVMSQSGEEHLSLV
jgi:hypothetical protein